MEMKSILGMIRRINFFNVVLCIIIQECYQECCLYSMFLFIGPKEDYVTPIAL